MLVLAAVLFCAVFNLLSQIKVGENIDFNFDWKFSLSVEDDAFAIDYDDSEWESVRLPHDWSIEQGYTQEETSAVNGFLPGGVGWYRKTFKVGREAEGVHTVIQFEGVCEFAEVWINGEYLGMYPCAYLGFEYDLTPYLRYGGAQNVIAVKVDRSAYANARWYIGGGIYRNVKLVTRNENYIATDGVSVTIPDISASRATVSVDVDVVRGSDEVEVVDVVNEIFLGDKLIASRRSSKSHYGQSTTFKQSIRVKNPSLWSLEEPTIYKVRSSIRKDGKVIDVKTTNFGIRDVRFDAAKGLFVNDKFVKIKGVNIHGDLGCVGVAVYDQVLYRRLKRLKEMGCNAIRTAHNPHSISLLNMCDTMGLMVMSEMFDEWKVPKKKWLADKTNIGVSDELAVGYVKYFNDWAERDLKSFIRRDRNHPSLILWSIGNEVEWTYPYYWISSGERVDLFKFEEFPSLEVQADSVKARFMRYSRGRDQLSETARDLVGWIKEVDTTHPVTLGANLPSVSRISGLMAALDVVGYNYKYAYYERGHKQYPDQPMIGTECVGQYHEWEAVMDKDYIAGIFLWPGISYLGECGPWPLKCYDNGLFDMACFKLARGHFFEALWSDNPKTHIVTTPAELSEFKMGDDGEFYMEYRNEVRNSAHGGWEWFDTFDKWRYADGEPIVVQVYSDSPQVELFLNGESLGEKNRADYPKDNVVPWMVNYADGELVAVGKVDGREVSRYTLKTNGASQAFEISLDKDQILADRYDVAHIEVTLIDGDGVVVTDDDRQIEFEVGNSVRILGIDNGDPRYVGSHKTNKITTYNGKCLLIIQSQNGRKGNSTIKAKMDNGFEKRINVKFV